MALEIKVEVKTSVLTSWTDISDYVTVNWSSGDIVAERRLGEFNAGLVTFTVIDRDTRTSAGATIAAHYWINALATSTTVPEVRVTLNNATLAAPQTLFYGRVVPSLYSYESDVLTSFTATPLLGYGDTLDAEPARNGEGALGQYSGTADALATTLLRKLGCLAGTNDDVEVHDYYLGATQDLTDWSHVKRFWSADTVDVATADTVGDIVPAPAGVNAGIVAFTVKHGKLFSISSAGDLTEILIGGASAATQGHRLFRFLGPAGVECLCIVRATQRSSYAVTQSQWGGAQYLSAGIGLSASIALMAMANPALGTILGVTGGSMAAQALVGEASKQVNATANNDRFWALRGVRVVSVGTGATGSVGATFDKSYTFQNGMDFWVPGDSICTSQTAPSTTTAKGEIWYALWTNSSGKYDLYCLKWLTAWGQWSNVPFAGTANKGAGIPTGGMASVGWPVTSAQRRVLLVGTTNGYVIHNQQTTGEYLTKFYSRASPPGRFVSALTNIHSGYYYAHFIYGNSAVGDNGYPVIVRQQALVSSVATETEITNMGDGATILEANPYTYAITVSGTDYQYASILWHLRDSDGRDLLRAGQLRLATTSGLIPSYSSSWQWCAYPLLETSGDWRPPAAFLDGGIYRLVALRSNLDRDRILIDVHTTSLYLKANVHHDFKRDPMTIGQALRELAASYWCYLRITTPDACNAADQVRVISRHKWTPASAGTISGDYADADVRVDGIEYYDGAVAQVGGQRIESGNTTVGKTVFSLRGAWLSPGWARAQTAEVVARYPMRSSSYPYGRRVFTVNALSLDQGTGVLKYPIWSDVFKRASFSAFTGISVSGIIQSVGVDVSRNEFPMRLLEYAVSAGVGDGVTWVSDEPAASITLLSTPTVEAIDDATANTPNKILVGWNCTHTISAVAQDNPKNFPCAWLQVVHVCRGGWLTGYAIKMTDTGLPTHGGLAVHLWELQANRPLTELPNTRAMCLSMDGYTAGLRFMPLADNSDPMVEGQPYYLTEGIYGLICVIDRQDEGPNPVTAPPLVWSDALVPAYDRAYYLNFYDIYQDGGVPIPTSLGWLDAWVAGSENVTQYAPDVQLVLT